MRLGTYRRTSQVVFTVLTIGGLFGIATTGLIYPYFFCYSCPWDVGACPIGILEHSVIDIQLASVVTGLAMLAFLFGFLSLIGLIFGRAFCGWACPVGLLQDVTNKPGIAGKTKKAIKPAIDPRAKYVKYVILIAIPILSYITLDLFYTRFCPVGGITGTLPTLTFYSGEWLFGSGFPLKIVSIILFMILIIFVSRGWCKYMCPVGAYLAPWNKVSAVRIKRDEGTCTNCGLCEKKCPMDIKDIGRKTDMECILCGRCVDSCNSNSLKLGPRFAKANLKGFVPWLIILILVSSVMAVGAMTEGYERTDTINAIPCLGCLALDPVSPENWYIADAEHPEFVLQNLSNGPVFLHYRTDVCAACDEMEPFIEELEDENGTEVHFIHINLDHASAAEAASYDVYDVLGTPDDRSGVPMFTVVSFNETGIIFKSSYGSSSDGGRMKKDDLSGINAEAIELYSQWGVAPVTGSNTFVELFVDTTCVNCPRSEDALLSLTASGDVSFISYVTDAPGISGDIGNGRETHYHDQISETWAHPWAIFAGGPVHRLGATTAVEQNYLGDIAAAGFEQRNLSVSGGLSESSGQLLAEFEIFNQEADDRTYQAEAFLVEKVSRWLNDEGEPIPNAVVDILLYQSFTLSAGESTSQSINWSGTDVLSYSDFRLSNLALTIVIWEDGEQAAVQVLTASVPEAVWLGADESAGVALPNGTASFAMELHNYLDWPMTYNLSVEDEADWTESLSVQSITVPAKGTGNFDLTVTGIATTAGDEVDFKVTAAGANDTTIFASSKPSVSVKDDITPPIILAPEFLPAEPGADEIITISATVGENVGIQSVKIMYYSCTPERCDPYTTDNMALEGNEYTIDVMAGAHDHTDFHYKIIAEDSSGNIAETELMDISLTPVPGHGDHEGGGTSNIVTYGIGLLLVFAMVAIGLVAAGSEKLAKQKKQSFEESDENDGAEKENDAEANH